MLQQKEKLRKSISGKFTSICSDPSAELAQHFDQSAADVHFPPATCQCAVPAAMHLDTGQKIQHQSLVGHDNMGICTALPHFTPYKDCRYTPPSTSFAYIQLLAVTDSHDIKTIGPSNLIRFHPSAIASCRGLSHRYPSNPRSSAPKQRPGAYVAKGAHGQSIVASWHSWRRRCA